MQVLITSGGTKIPIDRVRHIQNMSSGTFGAAIAKKALIDGHRVDFLRASKSKTPFKMEIDVMESCGSSVNILGSVGQLLDFHTKHHDQYREFVYDSFESYARVLELLLKSEKYDAVILAAAISDYGVENYVDGKIRSRDEDFSIKLMKLPKLIGKVKEWSKNPQVALIGFKLLVDSTEEELTEASRKSIADNGCDGIVANDLRDIKAGKHSIRTITKSGRVYSVGSTEELSAKVIEFTDFLIKDEEYL